MKVIKYIPTLQPEPTVALADVKPGDIFRFATDSFEKALDENLFYTRIDNPDVRVLIPIVSVEGMKYAARDPIHRVIIHRAEIAIHPNPEIVK